MQKENNSPKVVSEAKRRAGLARWDRRPLEVRFWSKVAIRGFDECWPWTAGRFNGTYGNFKGVTAHRLAFKLSRGELDERLDVLHRCDNPPCCNPTHLWQGTHKQNMEDRDTKGRFCPLRGEENGSAKLTVSDVREIRRLASEGITGITLDRRFGLSSGYSSRIVERKVWAHVP